MNIIIKTSEKGGLLLDGSSVTDTFTSLSLVAGDNITDNCWVSLHHSLPDSKLPITANSTKQPNHVSHLLDCNRQFSLHLEASTRTPNWESEL